MTGEVHGGCVCTGDIGSEDMSRCKNSGSSVLEKELVGVVAD